MGGRGCTVGGADTVSGRGGGRGCTVSGADTVSCRGEGCSVGVLLT